jgi:quercetin dioxygenase-like cupin family protein
VEISKLSDMKGGWFVGDFSPSVHASENFEVAVKEYEKGEFEESHTHRLALEITLIVSGKVQMNQKIFSAGDIIKILPGEFTDFRALEETITCVVKTPSVREDKFFKQD